VIFQSCLTSLSSADDIVALADGWNGIGLDGGWGEVARKLDVLNDDGVQTGVVELEGQYSTQLRKA
jgi:hypothetical protein